jgi:glycosyltransferase involved in cell wall biosynthesis
MRYVLLIPGWFPSEANFLAGDFIERHAKAASLYFPVKVLYVVKDNRLPFGKIRLEHRRHSENYESFIYYYSSGLSLKIVEKITSAWLQSKCLFRGFKHLTFKHGLPSLIHAHVLVKHAWFALKQSKKYKIPLLASEQWTGYLSEAKGEFESLSAFQKKYMKEVFHHAVHVTTVSDYLAQQIRKRFQFIDYTVIPNLVDENVFKPSSSESNYPTTFIHISTLSRQKNFDEIIEACLHVKEKSGKFKLLVVSPSHSFYQQQVNELDLSSHIIFKREVPQTELNKLMAASDALILYSNYETFGCVIVEANACGIPVIVSDFPVFEENVQEGITGFKVPLHDSQALANRMLKIINNQHSFNKEQIINITKENFSFEVIGRQFADVYNQYAKP